MLEALALATILGGSGLVSEPRQASPRPVPAEAALADSPGWETGGLSGGDVTALAISPTEPGEAFAAVRCLFVDGCELPVYRTADLGATWDTFPTWFYENSLSKRAVVTQEGYLLLADRSGVRFRHPIGTWSRAIFYPAPIRYGEPVDLAVSAQLDGPGMIAVARTELGTGGLAMANATIGMYQDTTPAPAVGLDGSAVAMHPQLTDNRAAAFRGAQGNARVFLTSDGGTTWLERSAGLPAAPVASMAYQGVRVVAVVEGHGVFAIQPGQTAWSAITSAQGPLRAATRIVVSPHDTQTLWVATRGGLSRSHDGGVNWQHQVPGTRGLNVHDIAPSPTDPELVLIGTAHWGVLSSLDGGQSFVLSTDGIQNLDVRDVAAAPSDPRRMAAIVQTTAAARLMESFDAGTTWRVGFSLPRHTRSLHFDHQGQLHALARANAGSAATLYRLQDGRAWQALRAPLRGADIQAVHFDAGQAGVIRVAGAASTAPGARAMTWSSRNGGVDWELDWQGPQDHVATQILGFADDNGDWLLVPTASRADAAGVIAISHDEGATWAETIMGFPRRDRHIQLCRHDGSQTVFAYTRNVNGFGDLFTYGLGSGADEWQHESGSAGQANAGFTCGDPATEELFVGSEQRVVEFHDPVLRKVAGEQFEAYDENFPLRPPHRATRMILTPAGLFLGSENGLFRNRAPVHAPAPHSLQVSEQRSRMARSIEVTFQAQASWVRVLRDGEEVFVGPNAGSFSERRLLDGSTPAYQVCNAFTEGCSAPATASR